MEEPHTAAATTTTPEPSKVEVLFGSDTFAVVNKPCNMNMDGDRPAGELTVERWGQWYLTHRAGGPDGVVGGDGSEAAPAAAPPSPGEYSVHFVHQLDFATSGVLCVAFTKEMAARLSHCFEVRTMKKQYLALVRGHMSVHDLVQKFADSAGKLPNWLRCDTYNGELAPGPVPAVTVSLPIAIDTDDPKQFRMKVASSGRAATTTIVPLECGFAVNTTRRDGATVQRVPCTRLLLLPFTGRRHQLRLHCCALGHAILGDRTYDEPTPPLGAPNVAVVSAEMFDRLMLHAWKLSLPFSLGELQAAGVDAHNVGTRSRMKRRRELKQYMLSQQEAQAPSGANTSGSEERCVFTAADPLCSNYVPPSLAVAQPT